MEDYQGRELSYIESSKEGTEKKTRLSVGKIYYLNTWLVTKEYVFTANEYVLLLEIKEVENSFYLLKLLTSRGIVDNGIGKSFDFSLFVEVC